MIWEEHNFNPNAAADYETLLSQFRTAVVIMNRYRNMYGIINKDYTNLLTKHYKNYKSELDYEWDVNAFLTTELEKLSDENKRLKEIIDEISSKHRK